MHFLQKRKIAATGLVWLQIFLFKIQKLQIFVYHWRSAKTVNSDIKNEGVRAIFHFLAFWPLLNLQPQVENFQWQVHSPLIFFDIFFLHGAAWKYLWSIR